MKQHIYHLSHIDLDGYGCQYLTTKCFDKIECYNANYGPEVTARLEEMVKKIEQDKFIHGDKIEPLILITDLNLTTKEGNWIEKEVMRIGAKIQLLDHHATGKSAAERFAWYKLDTSKCATLITYKWLQQHYGFDKENNYAKVVKAINAIDIWKSEETLFEYGKVIWCPSRKNPGATKLIPNLRSLPYRDSHLCAIVRDEATCFKCIRS